MKKISLLFIIAFIHSAFSMNKEGAVRCDTPTQSMSYGPYYFPLMEQKGLREWDSKEIEYTGKGLLIEALEMGEWQTQLVQWIIAKQGVYHISNKLTPNAIKSAKYKQTYDSSGKIEWKIKYPCHFYLKGAIDFSQKVTDPFLQSIKNEIDKKGWKKNSYNKLDACTVYRVESKNKIEIFSAIYDRKTLYQLLYKQDEIPE